MATVLKSKKIENQQKAKIPPNHIKTTLSTFQCPWMAAVSLPPYNQSKLWQNFWYIFLIKKITYSNLIKNFKITN